MTRSVANRYSLCQSYVSTYTKAIRPAWHAKPGKRTTPAGSCDPCAFHVACISAPVPTSPTLGSRRPVQLTDLRFSSSELTYCIACQLSHNVVRQEEGVHCDTSARARVRSMTRIRRRTFDARPATHRKLYRRPRTQASVRMRVDASARIDRLSSERQLALMPERSAAGYVIDHIGHN